MRTACDIESVQAELYRANPTIENYDIAALRFQTAQGLPLLYYTAHPIRTEFWGPVGVLEFENATITYTREKPVFRGVMADGSAFDYSGVAPGADMQKLMDAIQAVDSGDPPLCGVEAVCRIPRGTSGAAKPYHSGAFRAGAAGAYGYG